VRVLEHLGFEVRLLKQRRCCGRPSFSQGDLDRARRLGDQNLRLLAQHPQAPILFLEPSCYSMFREDYRELGLPGAAQVASRCHLLESFLADQAERHPEWRDRFRPLNTELVIHAHCHAKALSDVRYLTRLVELIWPGKQADLLNSGCCGMAGAFGATQSEYDLSCRVGQSLADLLSAQSDDASVIASGTSCRHQIEHLTPRRPRHFAEILSEAMKPI